MSAGASASEAVKKAPETGSKNEPPRTIVVRSSDGKEFEVDLAMAKQSEMIKKMIDAGSVERIVPLPNVDGPVLARVVEYWKQHASGKEDGDLKKWDVEFVKLLPKVELFMVMLAAEHLDTEPLYELCCQAVADNIKEMSVEEVRDYFGIENDLAPAEEARIRREHRWAFE